MESVIAKQYAMHVWRCSPGLWTHTYTQAHTPDHVQSIQNKHVRIGQELVITQNTYSIHITKRSVTRENQNKHTVRKDIMKTQYKHGNKLIYIYSNTKKFLVIIKVGFKEFKARAP